MSVYWDILSACKSALQADPDFAAASVTVAVRKRPFFSADHGDSYPFCCLSPTSERVKALQMSNGAWYDHPVRVVVFLAKNAALASETQLQLQLQLREAARSALYRDSLAGVASVRDCDYDPEPAFDLGALAEQHDVSCQQFTFRTDGPRV